MVDDKTPDQKVWRFFVCRMEIYRVENSKFVGLEIRNLSGLLLNYPLLSTKVIKVVIEILWYNEMVNLV